jgi:hypothetical protein
MLVTKNSIDLHWSQDGDFSLGVNGDIQKVDSSKARVARQLVVKRLQSSKGDWPLQQELGANVSAFAGQPNTREIGNLLKSNIIQSLTEGGLIRGDSLKVKIVPTALTKISILIYATVTMSNEPVTVHVEYDLRENKLIPRMI